MEAQAPRAASAATAILLALAAALSASWAVAGCAASPPRNTDATATMKSARNVVLAESTTDYERIPVGGELFLFGNPWNKGASPGPYAQRIFIEKAAAGSSAKVAGLGLPGWDWDWPRGSKVLSYPEIVLGKRPWDGGQGTEGPFPFTLREKSLRVDYEIEIEASGVYNVAFELWPVSALPASPGTITHEIMIWVYNQGITPAGGWDGSLESGGATYDLYARRSHGDASGGSSATWTYLAFVAREGSLKGSLKLDDFLGYLIEKGFLGPELYLTSLELGTEIVGGKGKLRLLRYEVVASP